MTLWLCLSSDRLYANVDELYDVSPEEEDPYSYGNESIYDSICYFPAPVSGQDISVVCLFLRDVRLCPLLPQPVKTTDADEKKAYVLAELFETEKNVVRVLNLICQSYFTAVRHLISAEDCRLLFDTAQVSVTIDDIKSAHHLPPSP